MKSIKNISQILFLAAFFLASGLNFKVPAQSSSVPSKTSAQQWQFAVSGDSRNCGDIVMPTIAKDVSQNNARFYWHLGDLRAVSDFDEDIKQRAGAKPQTILSYETTVWQDFIENQINHFKVPFFLGIGNHETVSPKTRGDFLIQFADWLNMPPLQNQRLKDDPNDRALRAYFHWQQDGVDFIYLDNATTDQLTKAQMNWFNRVMDRDKNDATIKTIVVGMHEALPDSISFDHSMSDYAAGIESGRLVYQRLLQAQNQENKKIYVLASHSHFFMEGIFNSEYWNAHGGVLPGWIVGTAGAHRYKLPPNAEKLARQAKTNVYGYLLATVNPANAPEGSINFEFHELKEQDVSADITGKFGADLVHWCFEKNSDAVLDVPK